MALSASRLCVCVRVPLRRSSILAHLVSCIWKIVLGSIGSRGSCQTEISLKFIEPHNNIIIQLHDVPALLVDLPGV